MIADVKKRGLENLLAGALPWLRYSEQLRQIHKNHWIQSNGEAVLNVQ